MNKIKAAVIFLMAFIIVGIHVRIVQAAVPDVSQTVVGSDTIEIIWSASGVDIYTATLYNAQGNVVTSVTTGAGTATFGQLTAGTPYYVQVVAAPESALETVDITQCTQVFTKPAKVSEFVISVWYPMVKPKGTTFPGYKANKTKLEWLNDNYSDGYELVIRSLAGKKLVSYNVKSNDIQYCSKVFNIKEIKNQGFKAEIKGYKLINNTTYYSDDVSEVIVIPQASIERITGTAKKRNVYWASVKGASKYLIYRVRNGKIKLLKTVGNKCTKATVTGLKSGDGVAVATQRKVKGKKTVSPITWYISQD